MRRWIDACRRRLKNRRGESVGEVLAALLISALALTMLAAMIASASRMVDDSRNRLDDYYQAENQLADPSGSPEGSGSVSLVGDNTSDEWDVEYYTDGNSVVSYRSR